MQDIFTPLLGIGKPCSMESECSSGSWSPCHQEVGYRDPDWDTTILICLRCRFNDGEKLTKDYFEISCINKDQYGEMRQTNWCSYWGKKN
jgi:hypothetical protein